MHPFQRLSVSLFLPLLALFTFLLNAPPAFAQMTYGSGVYTNLCGSGTAATFNSCSKNCNTNSGSCSASGKFVVKYVCDGRTTECRSNESNFASYQSVSGAGCGKTVQIDVFNKTCRDNAGNWICGSGDLKDYIVWYSGDCQQTPSTPAPTAAATPSPTPRPTATPSPSPTPRPTPSPTPHAFRCESLAVTAGNNSTVPSRVTLRARSTDNLGNIQGYRFYFGDGRNVESNSPEITHTYESSGSFLARVDVKDSRGAWRNSSSCEAWVTVRPAAVESHKSNCSDLHIVSGQNTRPPARVEFKVSGFDNKGNLSNYRLDFGNGVVKEQEGQTFENIYDKSGTYTVQASVKDSQGNWKSSDSCKKTVYIATEPLTNQPSTGTPTLFTAVGFTSTLSGLSLFAWRAMKKRK